LPSDEAWYPTCPARYGEPPFLICAPLDIPVGYLQCQACERPEKGQPEPTDRPPVAEVLTVAARQKRCPHAQRLACRCFCDVLDRNVHVWDDCRPCEHLPP
jgi:hypothetical protein